MRDVLQRLAPQVKLSVVVPCYNEVGNIGELYKRVSAACEKSVGSSYELILVNDGSRDETWEEIAALHFGDDRVVSVNLSRNYGHQVALSAGLSVCLGERVLILDADLQDPPELLPAMMEAIDRGADVAYGVRSERLGESWFKRASAGFFYRLLAQVVDIDIPTDTGDFRLLTRRAVDILVEMPEQHRFIRGMVSWIGLKQTPIMYQRQPRYFGVTKYPLTKMVRFALDAITGFSTRPLRIASYFGMISGFCAIILLSHVLYLWALGDTVEGWTSIVSVMLLLGAAQLFVIGIIGEYLGRLYMEAKGRPLFVVQDLLRAHRTIAPAHTGKKPKVPASTLASAD